MNRQAHDDNHGNGSRSSSRSFDWEQMRKQLELTAEALDGDDGKVSQAVLEETWARRAAQFAEVPVEEDQGAHVELVVVRLGGELYGMEASYVFRIRPATQVTPVPRVPAWIAGVANVRGRVMSVFDLRRYLDLPAGEDGEDAEPYLVVVETPEMALALLTDAVLNVESVPVRSIQEATESVRGIPQVYVRGLIDHDAGLLVVLDLRTLLADERLIVREEVV